MQRCGLDHRGRGESSLGLGELLPRGGCNEAAASECVVAGIGVEVHCRGVADNRIQQIAAVVPGEGEGVSGCEIRALR